MTRADQSESVVLSREAAGQIDRALHKTIVHLIATANKEPYPDDPRWSPWTRWQKPLADRCDQARKALRKAMGK